MVPDQASKAPSPRFPFWREPLIRKKQKFKLKVFKRRSNVERRRKRMSLIPSPTRQDRNRSSTLFWRSTAAAASTPTTDLARGGGRGRTFETARRIHNDNDDDDGDDGGGGGGDDGLGDSDVHFTMILLAEDDLFGVVHSLLLATSRTEMEREKKK